MWQHNCQRRIDEICRICGILNPHFFFAVCGLLPDPEQAVFTIWRHVTRNPKFYKDYFDFDELSRAVHAAAAHARWHQQTLQSSFVENELLGSETPLQWSFMGSTQQVYDRDEDWTNIFDDLDPEYWESYFAQPDDWRLADLPSDADTSNEDQCT